MKRLTVLMYHAIAEREVRDADPHYTVAKARFCEQLRLFRDRGLRLGSVRDILQDQKAKRDGGYVALTFDDGHRSNLDAAAEIAGNGGRADFFVNPSTIGRKNYLHWPDLRELVMHGMSIQSHGYTHRYLDEIPAAEVEHELTASKREIEDKTGQPVVLFAPPGGRMPRGFTQLARRAGYDAVCSSRPGTWKPDKGNEIARLAVLASTTNAQLTRWIAGDLFVMATQRMRYRALWGIKRLVGNRLYEQIRGGLLRRTG